jgi:arsenate reductase
MRRQNVLFVCGGNSCRSQMAEAFLRKHGGDRFAAHSCGLEATEIHPFTIAVMKEVGIDIVADGQRAEHVSTYLGKLPVAHLVAVCDAAAQRCPSVWPGALQRHTWPFEDPPAFAGTDEEKLAKFREVRDAIEARIVAWLREIETEETR